jgi:hypothetical protein
MACMNTIKRTVDKTSLFSEIEFTSIGANQTFFEKRKQTFTKFCGRR